MRPEGTVPVPAQARRDGELAEGQGIFGIEGLIMTFFVDIMGFIIGPHVFRPFGTGRHMLMRAELPVILPFQALGAGEIMVGPVRPLVIIEITQETRLGCLLLKMISHTVVVDQPVDGLIRRQVPAGRVGFIRRTVAVIVLMIGFHRQRRLVRQVLVQPQG